MKSILVHICCSVDSIYSLQLIKEKFPNYTIFGYFYNPNIHPFEEYFLRKIDTEYACYINNIELIEDDYEFENWFNITNAFEESPEKSERCVICHKNILQKTAEKCLELGIEHFTTTLFMSPLKSFEYLQNIGLAIAKKNNLTFIDINLKKGYATTETLSRTKEFQIYRQNYCGCFFGAYKHLQNNWTFLFSSPIKQKENTDTVNPGSTDYYSRLYALRLELYKKEISTNIVQTSFINYRVISAICKINDIIHGITIEPYSKGTNGRFKAKVETTYTDSYILSKSGITVLTPQCDFKRQPFNSDTVIRLQDIVLKKDDSIELTLKSEFDYSAKNYEMIFGEGEKIVEFNLYKDILPKCEEFDIIGKKYRIYCSFV